MTYTIPVSYDGLEVKVSYDLLYTIPVSDDGLNEIKQFIAKKQLNMTGDVEAHTVGGRRSTIKQIFKKVNKWKCFLIKKMRQILL